MTERVCKTCKESKSDDKFTDVKRKQCKDCDYQNRSYNKGNNPESFFKMQLRHSKASAVLKAEKGRKDAGICTLTIDDIMEIHDKQKGLCYYSGIPYTCKIKSDWKCSLERKNPSKGYTKDNVVIATSEFNCTSQWSLEKIQELYTLLYIKHEPNKVDFGLGKKEKKPMTVYKKEFIDGVECVNCGHCKSVKPLTEFATKYTEGCLECLRKIHKRIRETPRGHMQKVKRGMKGTTKTKNTKGYSHDDSEFELQDMIELFNIQNGLCAYSGIPLKFGCRYTDNWLCSPERLDTTKGYVKGNVCLICHEFNTSVQTGGDGNSGWSKEKIETLKLALKEKYNNVVG